MKKNNCKFISIHLEFLIFSFIHHMLRQKWRGHIHDISILTRGGTLPPRLLPMLRAFDVYTQSVFIWKLIVFTLEYSHDRNLDSFTVWRAKTMNETYRGLLCRLRSRSWSLHWTKIVTINTAPMNTYCSYIFFEIIVGAYAITVSRSAHKMLFKYVCFLLHL